MSAAETEEPQRAKGHATRLFVRAKFVGYSRSRYRVRHRSAVLALEGVHNPKHASFYFGKRVAYVYRGKKLQNGTRRRVIWGKVVRAHGKNGQVRARFMPNLPGQAIGGNIRVMLYPSHI